MGPGGQEDRCPAPGEVVVIGVEEPCPIPRVVMKIFEDFGEGLCEESIIQKPISIVHYKYDSAHKQEFYNRKSH